MQGLHFYENLLGGLSQIKPIHINNVQEDVQVMGVIYFRMQVQCSMPPEENAQFVFNSKNQEFRQTNR